MAQKLNVALLISDKAVLSSLDFALTVEGIKVLRDERAWSGAHSVAALVIDRGTLSESLAELSSLRSVGCGAAAIVLATNPTVRQHADTLAAGAVLVEKPLLCDELSRALHEALNFERAA